MLVAVGELVLADGEDGGELFERGVAGALADAVDGALDLPYARFDGSDGVRDGEAEVVVAVGGEDDVFDAGHAGADMRNICGVVLRDAVADGVGEVEGGGAGLDGDLADLDEEVAVGAGGVLGGELDVVAVAAWRGRPWRRSGRWPVRA